MKILKNILKLIMFFILIVCTIIGVYVYKAYDSVQHDIKNGIIEKKTNELKNKKAYTRLEDLDKKYREAVIAAEDHRFYNHGAVDFQSLLRAVDINIRKKQFVEGGSTITQQLVKNLFFDQGQNFERKLKEYFMSVEMEKKFTKDQILEMYVNKSYFGSGYYSIKEASKGYFDKTPDILTLSEAAFLAGVPNAPSVYDPRVNKNLAVQRRRIVLEKMITYGYISAEEAKMASEQELEVK